MLETRSTCPYCGVGCGVIIATQDARITGVRGDPDHPANFGRLCTKGSTLHLTATPAITQQTRLLQPLRRLHRNGAPQPVTWDAALDFAAEGFAQIVQEHGPDSVGFYISGQLLTEDYYVFNKLVKGVIGTNNLDSNSRLCMSSAVAGYKQTLGADAPPACYDDVNHADCLFITGSNAAYAHPVLFRRIEEAKAQRDASRAPLRVIVCDPRRTDTADFADLYLPVLPGTDVMLFNGMLHIMLWEGWIRQDYIDLFTRNFAALKTLVRDCTPELVAQTCGVRKEDLFTAAQWFAQSGATLSLYCQGLNQSSSGTAKNTALINLHLATAQIGKPGAGPFSLTGQPNAMGGREVGGMANLMSAHRDLANPAHRAEVEALWGLSALGRSVPSAPGKTAVEMFQAAADGEIKALWIACTNPAQSMPDQATVRRALQRAELVVVQEAFATAATAEFADLLLPATTWGEKAGTVTNSERRISRVRAAVPAPGQTRPDWAIAAQFGQRLAKRLGLPTTLLDYATPESVWNEHRDSTRGRDLDITGLSYALLDTDGPQQWPYPSGASQGTARLYADGQFPTPDGRAKFVANAYRPVAEPRESRYPFSLNTGRLRDQWHGMTRTGTLGRLFGHAAEPCLHMHPQDMQRRQLTPGDLVHVTSKRGSIVVPVQTGADVGLSQVFMAMHWGPEYLSGRSSTGDVLAGVNALTTSAFCESSKQPELKHAAVKVLKAEMPWNLLGLAWLPSDTVLTAQRQLRALMPSFAFASCVPFSDNQPLVGAGEGAVTDAVTGAITGDKTSSPARGQAGRTGILFRAAAYDPADSELIAQIETALGLRVADTLRYSDPRKGQHRAARLVRHSAGKLGSVGNGFKVSNGEVLLEAVLLCGDTRAEAWIKTVLQDALPAGAYGRQLLSPSAKAPVAIQSRGKVVCSCFNVTDLAIAQHLKGLSEQGSNEAAAMASLQSTLRCGTNCGSCIPELKKAVRAAGAVEAKIGVA